MESGNLSRKDSLFYSIYKDSKRNDFVFSFEKLISNEDQEKYEIIDIFRFVDYSNETKVLQDHENNNYTVSLVNRGNTLKKWTFQDSRVLKTVNSSWQGTYEGSFLRLKDEFADPRAWGQIELEIHDKKAVLRVDSFVEIVEKNLTVVAESATELKLKEESDHKTLTLTKKSSRFSLEGNLMESIVGSKENYEIKKIADD